jgi:cytochrome o ubiquinol oxidase subunit 2
MRELTTAAARRLARASLFPVLGLHLLGLLGGCDWVVMNPTGDVAMQQRDLILIATALMLLIIVPVMALTVLFAWRYRASNTSATYDPEFDHSTSLELVIWSCPLLIIIALGAVTWSSTHLLDPYRELDRIAPGKPVAPGTKPLDIQVIALDWKFLFIYPQQGIATVNELALPVNVPVRFSITSTDQMNTFYVPTLAGMVYAMPGMQSAMHAVLNKPGESWGQSANYTGAGYSDMRFSVHGLDQAGFDRWAAQVKAGGTLDTAVFTRLAKPSEKVPVMHFGTVQPALFGRVVNRCVEPRKPCMADVMKRDMQMGGGDPHSVRAGEGNPPGRDSAPLFGKKPKPALMKAPEEKGSGPNVTKPRGSSGAGQTKPGDPSNRDMSAITPLRSPGAPRVGAA